MQQHNTPSTDSGFPSGLIAALVAFALTWFVVNGGEAREAHGTVSATEAYSVCDMPEGIPTSRFFNAPVAMPVPLQGG